MVSRALTERVAAVVFGCADMWARLCRPMVREFFAWAEQRFPESLFAALESSPALAAALVLSGFDGRSCEHVWKTIPSFKIIARCKKNIAHYVGKNRFPPWCLGPAAIAALREKGADWSDLELVADEEGLAHIAAHASISEAAVVRLLHRCSENWETSSHTVGLARGPPPHECMRFARAINTFRVTPSLLERSGIEQKLRFLFADKTLERAAAAPAISDEGW